MICTNYYEVNHYKEELSKPFVAKLSSAMNGSRLVKSLLEIISSKFLTTMEQIAIFIKQTLVLQLTVCEKCNRCSDSFETNRGIFGQIE